MFCLFLMLDNVLRAGPNGRVVYEHWDRGFEPTRGMDVCPRFSVLSCVGTGLASGRSPVQGVLPKV
jgi:hypothetical protein